MNCGPLDPIKGREAEEILRRICDASDSGTDSDESKDNKGNLHDGPYEEFRLHVFEAIVNIIC